RRPTGRGRCLRERGARERPPGRQPATESTPRFDMILLGMGADGHTASLFPGSDALAEEQRLVIASRATTAPEERLTFTFPLINAARRVLFLVSGVEKAHSLSDVLTGPHQPDRWPSQGVHPVDGQLTWLVDEAAFSTIEATLTLNDTAQ
ncbi:MAG: hypothetical protein HC802_12085, partial [Caldilineaceae bacterium]|nr:hypothetical protein [Caldilineaceae bacterium]